VLALVEDGLLTLDDPLAAHVPDWPFPNAGQEADAVTVRQLLAHRAGLQLGTIGLEFAPDEPRPSRRAHLAEEAVLVQPPGEGFLYSNPGYDLLELLVEEVTGTSFASVAEDRVLGPLGMADAGFAWDEDRAARLASGHELDGSTVAPYVYATSASGGLLATVDDLGQFAAVLVTADAGSTRQHERAIAGLLTPTGPLAGPYRAVADRHGMGVFLETLPDGGDAAFSGGQGHGWMSHLHVLPGAGDGVVILTNSQRSWPLIAHVLTDWAELAGAGTVGMGRIVTATRLLWGAIAGDPRRLRLAGLAPGQTSSASPGRQAREADPEHGTSPAAGNGRAQCPRDPRVGRAAGLPLRHLGLPRRQPVAGVVDRDLRGRPRGLGRVPDPGGHEPYATAPATWGCRARAVTRPTRAWTPCRSLMPTSPDGGT
jgi:CubicO group peptidase (beta-lactamase class C family)